MAKQIYNTNILVIIINPGKENLKLDFTSTIDISEFVLNKDKNKWLLNDISDMDREKIHGLYRG